MDFIEPCFGIGHNLSLICQMTSEDIKHQLIIIIILGYSQQTISGMKWPQQLSTDPPQKSVTALKDDIVAVFGSLRRIKTAGKLLFTELVMGSYPRLISVLVLHLISHRLTVVYVSFCNLVKGITLEFNKGFSYQ